MAPHPTAQPVCVSGISFLIQFEGCEGLFAVDLERSQTHILAAGVKQVHKANRWGYCLFFFFSLLLALEVVIATRTH